MARETIASKRQRALNIADALNRAIPEPDTELLYWDDPFRLTIAVLLSAQTTDKAVNKVTPILWERYPTIDDLASAKVTDVEMILHEIGFFRTKAAHCIQCAQMVLSDFDGDIPADIDLLQKLPGVGRKTANIVMNVAFDNVCGIAVDTHVFRITHKLKLSNADTPAKTELDLLKVFPKETWKALNHQLVLFGRSTCTARKPKCNECPLAEYCPSCDSES